MTTTCKNNDLGSCIKDYVPCTHCLQKLVYLDSKEIPKTVSTALKPRKPMTPVVSEDQKNTLRDLAKESKKVTGKLKT